MSFHHGDPWGRPPPPPPIEDHAFYATPGSPRNGAPRGVSSPWGFGAPAPSLSPTSSSAAPPLPPPSLHVHDPPFYHVPYPQQQQQQQPSLMHRPPPPLPHHQQLQQHHLSAPPQAAQQSAPFFSQFGSPPPPPGQFSSSTNNASFFSSGNAGFDLSQSMGGLRLSPNDSGRASAAVAPLAFPSSSPSASSSPFGSIGAPSPSSAPDPWSSNGLSSDRMRDQMNQQMAALYRSGGGIGSPTEDPYQQQQQQNQPNQRQQMSLQQQHQHQQILEHQRQRQQQQSTPSSGESSLLGLLHKPGPTALGGFGSLDAARPRPPPIAMSSSFPPPLPPHLLPPGHPSQLQQQPQPSPLRHYQQQQQQQQQREFSMGGADDLLGYGNTPSGRAQQQQQQHHPLSSSSDDRDRFLSAPRPVVRSTSGTQSTPMMMMARSPQPPPHHNHHHGMARSLPPARSPLHHGGGNNGGFEPLTRRDSFGSTNSSSSTPSAGSSSIITGSGSSTAVVTPDLTKPNDTIKVQVSLLTDECRPGRVLLIGLFRIGQPTNEKPIFVKQVLFENKIHRQAKFWNTRITFRAPRSPGEFEFRIFEELKSRHFSQQTGQQNQQLQLQQQGDAADYEGNNGGAGGGAAPSGLYSNATIVRSNRLKVAMDYSHFIEFLRSITEKFRQNRMKRDTGGILSNLLAFMRLIDQIETVFLHGQALLEDFISDLLSLVSMDDQEMARFPMTDTIPSPVETFHGTIRNVLNSVQANPWIKEFVTFECLQQVEFYQKRLYCAVSGLYFRSNTEKANYWLAHYQFEPPSGTPEESEPYKAFLDGPVSNWIIKEANKLMPDADEFRFQRQAVYQIIFTQVVCHLDPNLDAQLDVFGSSANDFGTSQSDMDMCLVLRPDLLASMNVDDKRRVLSQVVSLLEARPDLFTDVDASRLSARIPIVMFKMAETGLECDLCVENVLAQRNTSLLRAYANCDERVRILAFIVKQFVQKRRMNCAAESTLSSYGYLLMLIHFLQKQDPPIVPVLQTLPPNWDGSALCGCSTGASGTSTERTCPLRAPYCRLTERTEEVAKQHQLPSVLSRTPGSALNEGSDTPAPVSGLAPGTPGGATIAGGGASALLGSPPPQPPTVSSSSSNGQVETYFFDPFAFPDPSDKLSLLHQFGARNTQSVGALLVGFFQFFGLDFDASTCVVSVRMGRELHKNEKKMSHQWKLHSRLSIEDPFEISYDVAHVLKGTRDKYIRQQFVRAFTLLTQAASSSSAAEASSLQATEAIDQVMALVNEPVGELPFHTYKDQANVSATTTSAAATAAMNMNMAHAAAAAATAASVFGGVFSDAFFDASSFTD